VEPAEKVEVLVEPIEIVRKPVAEIVVACEPALLVANLLPEAGGRSARKSSQSVVSRSTTGLASRAALQAPRSAAQPWSAGR
jgi:hypothetical protein